jgi:hypothetical protein
MKAVEYLAQWRPGTWVGVKELVLGRQKHRGIVNWMEVSDVLKHSSARPLFSKDWAIRHCRTIFHSNF